MALKSLHPIPAHALDPTWTMQATHAGDTSGKGLQATVALFNGTLQAFENVSLGDPTARQALAAKYATQTGLAAAEIEAGLLQLIFQIVGILQQRQAAPPTATGAPTWQDGLKRDRQGRPYEEMANIDLVLTHADPWKHDALWYDTMCSKTMLGDQPIGDYIQLAMEIGRLVDMPVRNPKLHEKVIRSRCLTHPRDRLQEYLASLQGTWDKKRRLHTWLSRYAGVTLTPAAKYISWMLPISMVARGLHPGCDMRYAVIFEGEEDIGKGQILRVLGGEFYKEITEITGKEARMALKGVWLGELSELHALSRAELAHIKAFISAVADPYVPKYENDGIVQTRRCVLAGTTNEEIYLKNTGNTRFFPVKCSGTIKYEDLANDRDQLFAEALVQYAKHKRDWWKIPDDAKKELIELRKAKQDLNIYDNVVREYLKNVIASNITTLDEVFKDCLLLEAREKWGNKALQMQVSEAMKNAGWERAKVNDVRSWVGPTHAQHAAYVNPAPTGPAPTSSRCPQAPTGKHDPYMKAQVLTCMKCGVALF